MGKPELVIQDFGGAHNADLGKTRARLSKGGSWRKQRIVVVIPSADLIPAKVVLSWLNLAFPPNNGVARIVALGQEVGEAYSSALEQILAHPELGTWEYLLTIEHDSLVPADGVLKLLERMEEHPEFNCIGGLYFTKGEGGVAQIWGSVDGKDGSGGAPNFRPQLPDPNGGLVECYGTGMGFNLWRLQAFKNPALRRPWFVTQKKDGVATQDLYFAGDARKHGWRFAICCATKVGHYDYSTDTAW